MAGQSDDISVIQYDHGLEAKYLPAMRSLITEGLSEPYSIYVYRYFLCQWGHLCYMVRLSPHSPTAVPFFHHRLLTRTQAVDPVDGSLIGVIICKLETHSSHSPPTRRGYIAMLAVATPYRGKGIATTLVKQAIDAMAERKADEIVLETEETNTPAMRLYERLGFLRSKKLHRYYLNGNSAYRLVLLLKSIDPDALADDSGEGFI